MNLYFAPMEGITGYIFRNEFEKNFGGIDKYYTPFIAPMEKKILRKKEAKDVDPKNNIGSCIPQLLTNNPDGFIAASKYLYNLGYREVNLNLGCPSNTVAAKGKGSGFLKYPDALDSFFERVFELAWENKLDGMEISLKTRLGIEDPKEFTTILNIYNKYNFKEITLHPRVKTDLYKGKPRMDYFDIAYDQSSNPLCFNGDIKTVQDYLTLSEKYPKLSGLMIGRGFLENPMFAYEIKKALNKDYSFAGAFDISKPLQSNIMEFHNILYKCYMEELQDKKNVSFKMKELWAYWGKNFENQKAVHKILISKSPDEYSKWLDTLARDCF